VKIAVRLLAAAFAPIGIATVTHQVVTTATLRPEIMILTAQEAFFISRPGILLATASSR